MKWISTDDFHKQMDENPNAVYVVETYNGLDRKQLGLFSTKEKAQAWCDSWDDDHSCVVCPFVIDEPDFGNIPKKGLAWVTN